MTISRSRAKQITQRLLKASTLDDVQIWISGSRDGNTRFARNQPTTTGDIEELTITVTATTDGRSATVTGNRDDNESLQAMVKQAEEMARMSPQDPEAMPPLGPQKYASVNAVDAKVRKFDAADRASFVKTVVEYAKGKGLIASGLMRYC